MEGGRLDLNPILFIYNSFAYLDNIGEDIEANGPHTDDGIKTGQQEES